LKRVPFVYAQVRRTSSITSPTTFTTYFAESAGVRSLGWGESPALSGKFYAVRVNCLDGVDIDVLVDAPITHFDGAKDNDDSPPAEMTRDTQR
jgi:hypothetical protein